jgi:hypothetical protein
MFTLILGKDEDTIVDEGMVAIMDLYTGHPAPSFRYAEALAVGIRQQLSHVETDKVFRYSSYLVYLFIFYQSAHLTHLNLQQFHEGIPTRCIDWLPWVKKGEYESSLAKHISQFLNQAQLIRERSLPPLLKPLLPWREWFQSVAPAINCVGHTLLFVCSFYYNRELFPPPPDQGNKYSLISLSLFEGRESQALP